MKAVVSRLITCIFAFYFTIKLGIKCLPDMAPEKFDKLMLELLHEILLEVNVEDGQMKCKGCGRVYVIKDSIPNMLLQENEV